MKRLGAVLLFYNLVLTFFTDTDWYKRNYTTIDFCDTPFYILSAPILFIYFYRMEQFYKLCFISAYSLLALKIAYNQSVIIHQTYQFFFYIFLSIPIILEIDLQLNKNKK